MAAEDGCQEGLRDHGNERDVGKLKFARPRVRVRESALRALQAAGINHHFYP